MVDRIVEPFQKRHDRDGFACGQATLDDFLRTRVTQYDKRRLGRTFVAVARGEVKILGYYTLAAGSVSFDKLPADAARKLPKHPVPVVLLARLAVDLTTQGTRLGELLLLDALHRALGVAAGLGVYTVEVDAIDDRAAAFYRKYGFTPLLDDPHHLYSSIATVEALLIAGSVTPPP